MDLKAVIAKKKRFVLLFFIQAASEVPDSSVQPQQLLSSSSSLAFQAWLSSLSASVTRCSDPLCALGAWRLRFGPSSPFCWRRAESRRINATACLHQWQVGLVRGDVEINQL